MKDFVLLTPVDILRKEDIWINRRDIQEQFDQVLASMENDALREQINNHVHRAIAAADEDDAKAQKEAEKQARMGVVQTFPEFLEHHLKFKEVHGDEAEALSEENVRESRLVCDENVRGLLAMLQAAGPFITLPSDTLADTRARIMFFEDVIENEDGWRPFLANGKPIRRELDVQLMFRFVWFATELDVYREVNNGRGPVDFTVSAGRRGKSLVEFKLANNTKLKKNLANQTQIYAKASDAEQKVIVYYSTAEHEKVKKIRKELDLESDRNVILIDARPDNKPSASNADSTELDDAA